jgi:hypothetical protein
MEQQRGKPWEFDETHIEEGCILTTSIPNWCKIFYQYSHFTMDEKRDKKKRIGTARIK